MAASSLVGAILGGRYRLTALIGEGGMGQVYRADSADGQHSVAIKVLMPEFARDETILSRFVDEGHAGLRLNHPNIVRTLEVDRAEDGSPFIVMELLVGVPLKAYTAEGKRIALPRAAAILHGVLSGLGAAHAQGVVHRDLKPGNVHLARDASGRFGVKILDFGIAKVMDAAGGMGKKTATGMLLGTPAYMSPEQIRAAKTVDPRSDLWAAGVLFYELLTGRQAFAAPTEYARLSAVLLQEPEPIERLDPKLLPVSDFMRRALQKERGARFQSAGEMASYLSQCVGGSVDLQTAHAEYGPTPASVLARDVAAPSYFAPAATGSPVGSMPGPLMSHPPGTQMAAHPAPHFPPPVAAPMEPDEAGTTADRPSSLGLQPASHATLASPLSPPSVGAPSVPPPQVVIDSGKQYRRMPIAVGVALLFVGLLVGGAVGFLIGRGL